MGGLVRAYYRGGTTFGLEANYTAFSMADIAVSVLQVRSIP